VRTLSASSDANGSFNSSFVADPNGHLSVHIVGASDGNESGWASYQVVSDDDPTKDPPTDDVLRTYRLALITDPGYAAFFGGSANVTAPKLTLMNRVDQLCEDELSIRMVLVANNDLPNLDTRAQATGPNGPCGAAPCFTQSEVTGLLQHDTRPIRDRTDHRRHDNRNGELYNINRTVWTSDRCPGQQLLPRHDVGHCRGSTALMAALSPVVATWTLESLAEPTRLTRAHR
jgi:Metallo-peptidase family M12